MEEEYDLLGHVQTSALFGEGVKRVFDEAILYMLKVKRANQELLKAQELDETEEHHEDAGQKLQAVKEKMGEGAKAVGEGAKKLGQSISNAFGNLKGKVN